MNSLLLNEHQAAEHLGSISVKTLRRWRCEGTHIPFVKIGASVRYSQSSLDDYLDACIRTSTSDKG